MSPKEQKLRADAKARLISAKAILDGAKDGIPSEAENIQVASIRKEAKDMLAAADNMAALESEMTALDRPMSRGSERRTIDTDETAIDADEEGGLDRVKTIVKRLVTAKAAYRFGMYAMLTGARNGGGLVNVNQKTLQKAQGLFDLNALHFEGSDIPGGVLVPPEFEWDIINLRETFGTFRRNVAVKNMTRDVKIIPRRTSGLTMYLVGEAARINASSKTWDQIKLVAKKCGVLAVSSAELDEDSAIDIGTDLMSEIAYAMGLGEDQAGWNGDGTSGGTTEYLGMLGVTYKIKALSSTIANIYGLTVATGTGYATSYGSITLADFNKVIANLPAYADTPGTKFYCHRTFYYSVMQRLAAAAGGVQFHEIIDGVRRPSFLGYPVEFVQVMPRTSAINQVCCLFGDLKLAAKMGNRKELEFGVSRDATVVDNGTTYNMFQNDMVAWRGIERFDINVHDVGRASDNFTPTAALPGQGPIVGLITAAS